MSNFVCYLRVSTTEQGISGLGLEAQEKACRDYAAAQGGKVIACYTEVESGKVNDRPKLAEAFRHADLSKAVVVFSKLDRLSRNAAFLLNLKDSGVKFAALDCPVLDTLNVGMRATFAQHEREVISQRTKDGMAAAKARGKRMGNPDGFAAGVADRGRAASVASRMAASSAFAEKYRGIITRLQAEGVTTLSGIAAALNNESLYPPRGGRWEAKGIKRLLEKLA